MLEGFDQAWDVTVLEDATAAQIRSKIYSTFQDADADDICLFFYSGHGYTDLYYAYEEYEGALAGVDGSSYTSSQLAYALTEATPAKVIVLLDSCGSGAVIYDQNGKEISPQTMARRNTGKMISAFSYFNTRAKEKAAAEDKSGEMRVEDKFYVIAACEYQKTSIEFGYTSGYHFGLFTYALCWSAGFDHKTCTFDTGSMHADSNEDGRLTLGEAYNGIEYMVDYYETQRSKFYQTTQVFGNSSFVLFSR